MEIAVELKRVKDLVLFAEIGRGAADGVAFRVNITFRGDMLFIDFPDERYEMRAEAFVDAVAKDREKRKKALVVQSN